MVNKIFNYINFKIFNYLIKKIKLLSLKKIHQKNIIWVFATPKSGSTYTSFYLQKNMSDRALITPFDKIASSYHEINIFLVFFKILANPKKKFVTINIHSKFNKNYLRCFSKNHLVIVQYRNIYYSIESYIDHIEELIENNQFEHFLFNVNVKNWKAFSFTQKIDFLIFFYLPWHLDFITSWYESKLPCDKLYINYFDLFSETNNFFEKNNIITNKIKKEELLDKSHSRFKQGFNRKIKMNKKQMLEIREKIHKHLEKYNLDIEKFFFK